MRGYLAIGPLRQAGGAIGEDQVAAFMRTAFAPLVRPGGTVGLTEEYRLRIARSRV